MESNAQDSALSSVDENNMGNLGVAAGGNELEEYKINAENTRFIITKYVETFTIYLALMGFGIRELVAESKTAFVVSALFAVLLLLSALAIIVFSKFKQMALHTLARQEELATVLKMHRPRSVKWGYSWVIIFVAIMMAFLFAMTYYKFSIL
jgi:hypothetical protein